MTVVSIILLISINALMLASCFLSYMLGKNANTHTKRRIIIDAISSYKHNALDKYDFTALHLVEYDDMEEYSVTMWRLWDWGYTRILPKEKFELVKKYISPVTEVKNEQKKG